MFKQKRGRDYDIMRSKLSLGGIFLDRVSEGRREIYDRAEKALAAKVSTRVSVLCKFRVPSSSFFPVVESRENALNGTIEINSKLSPLIISLNGSS